MGMSTCRMAAPRLAFECVRPAGRALRSAATMRHMPLLMPPRIVPPAQPLGRIAFMKAFVRNPLQVLPRAAYEEDFVAFGSEKAPRAWVTSPALIKAVLLDERDKFGKLTQIRLLGPLLGKGILTSEGTEWKWQRQASAPMFRPQELAGFVPAFVRAAEDALARWRARPPDAVHAIDDEQLVDNLLTFSLAGHETTAKALTWTLYLLARSPDWTGRLEREIERVTGGAAVRAEHVEKLAGVQQVIKESMRLYPPVPMMSRQAVADARIDG